MIRLRPAPWLTVPAALAAVALPLGAEVYLTEAQALTALLGDRVIPRREQKVMDRELRAKLERASNLHFPENSFTFFIAGQPGQSPTYAVAMNEIGKSEPITFMVAMDDHGKVTGVVIMEFRENRGWEVKEKRFLNQFRGKTVRSSIRVDEDIVNYTGATLSSKAVARGVKRALLLLEAFYPAEQRQKALPAQHFEKPAPIPPLVTLATPSEGDIGLYRQVRCAMGSLCEIRAWCRTGDQAQAALQRAFLEINRVEERFSAFRETSELSLVNREAGGSAVPVSREFYRLTNYAVRAWHRSQGLADITVGPLAQLWKSHRDLGQLPDHRAIAAAQQLVGGHRIELGREARTVQFAKKGMHLDFGGFVKGYAAERAAAVLEREGVLAGLVNLGRSSLSATRHASIPTMDGVAEELGVLPGEWPVAVAHPDPQEPCPAGLVLRPGDHLATSGTGEQQFQIAGRTLSHLIDPRTGWPLEGLHSATVVARSGLRSEWRAKEILFQDSPARFTASDRSTAERRLRMAVRSGNRLQIRKNAEIDLWMPSSAFPSDRS